MLTWSTGVNFREKKVCQVPVLFFLIYNGGLGALKNYHFSQVFFFTDNFMEMNALILLLIF